MARVVYEQSGGEPVNRAFFLLRLGGVGACLLSIAFTVSEVLFRSSPSGDAGCLLEVMAGALHWPREGIALAEGLVIGIFTVAFWRATRLDSFLRARPDAVPLLLLQSVLALLVAPELLLLVGAEVAFAL